MTNREALIQGLQKRDWETDRIYTSMIACPYVNKCENPYKYGTTNYQVFCDEVCKTAWLDEEAGEEE